MGVGVFLPVPGWFGCAPRVLAFSCFLVGLISGWLLCLLVLGRFGCVLWALAFP